MKKKLHRGNLGSRVIAIVITFSMVVSLMTVLGGDASAATSLSGIESIKSRGTVSILEIVPKKEANSIGYGSIGYYIGGREPIANWLTVLASKQGKDARDAYAKQLFDNLKAVGLMGASNQSSANYPLIQTSNYEEFLPWDTIPANKDVVRVPLDHTEEKQVKGTFTPDTAGDYIETKTYVFDATGGDFVENALYYKHGQMGGTDAESTYYYSLTFTRLYLTESNVRDYIGDALYVPVSDPAIPGYTYYEYAGTLEEDGGDFTIEDEINDPDGIGYFIAEIVNDTTARKPSATWECLQEVTVTTATIPSLVGSTLYMDAGGESEGYTAVKIETGYVPVSGAVYYKLMDKAHSYYAVKDPQPPYRRAVTGETGYFDELIGYRYVGNGNAANNDTYYKFTASSSGTLQNLVYDTISVTDSYTNSEWFKRYVLDMDGASDDVMAAMRVTVSSVTPDELTETMVKNANLVVVSAGFDLTNGGSTVAYTRDVTDTAVLNALKSKPRVVDNRISGASNLASLLDGTTIPGVTANNVYNFAGGTTGTDGRSALATNQFHTAFSNTTPYAVVAAEITYENFLRETTKQDPLPEAISMATCIRYVLNTHRVQNKKTSLNVLDIQPAAKYDGATGPLTVNTVLSWLPPETQTTLKNSDNTYRINITHMSTAALIGKIEDISEQYDLIYIGANEKGAKLPSGFYYSNIGAESSVNSNSSKLAGLLSTGNGTARYSGNDLTPKKHDELLAYANAGLPIVISDTLLSGTSNTENHTLSATVTGSGNLLTVRYDINPGMPNASDITNVEYQWQYRTGKNRNWRDASGSANGQTYNATDDYEYRCLVSVKYNGNTYTANSNVVKRGSSGSTIYSQKFEIKPNSTWNNTASTYYVGNNPVATNDTNGTLSVSYTRNRSVHSERNLTYSWYREGSNRAVSSGSTATSFDVDNNGSYDTYYYCVISIQYKTSRHGSWKTATCTSPSYKLVRTAVGSTGGGDATTTVAGTSTTIPVQVGGEAKLDRTKVDYCSLMYDVLNKVWAKPNVVAESSVTKKTTGTNIPELNDNQDNLVKYLNLSCPSINLISYPTEYGGNFSQLASYNCAGNLTFKFTINNPTDPTPQQTRYTCNLYIDQNGDGRHSEEEQVGDFLLRTSNNTLVSGGLEANTTYVLERNLGDQYSGIVPWKLEIVKVGDLSVHASEKGYAYNQPKEPTVIKVLQIRHSGKDGTSGKGDNLSNDTDFTDLYDEVKRAKMYDIRVTATSVYDLNQKSSQADVFSTLDNYDMIVLGFYDCYGELNEKTAKAVAQYIDTGKAVLFTHDTTSFCNVSSNSEWGYHFNQIIRDKVGLDRYGVSNATFKAMGVNAGTDGAIISTEATALQAAGYTVAYVPNSSFQSAAETQGYTNITIDRYPSGKSNNGTETTSVSQVNQGQITQYPYTLGTTMSVASTHEQYYQLNMNSEDIVVWYCLSADSSSSKYANYTNDVTNAYYIYNRGNITYSGAGHTQGIEGNEAKLFVNTMIAAYRATFSKPTIEFKTANDYPATAQLIPMEYTASSSQSLGTDQTIYFKLEDTNLTTNKSISVEMYYDVAADTSQSVTMESAGLVDTTDTSTGQGNSQLKYVKKATLGNIYRADTGQLVTDTTKLSSGILYKAVIPAEVLSYFSAQSAWECQIYLKVTTTIHNNGSTNNTYTGKDSLTLQKLGLLRLE